MSETHACPGGCGTQVPRHHLACKPCWFRLPAPLRDDVNAAWRTRRTDLGKHRRALQAALAWYRANPTEATDGQRA